MHFKASRGGKWLGIIGWELTYFFQKSEIDTLLEKMYAFVVGRGRITVRSCVWKKTNRKNIFERESFQHKFTFQHTGVSNSQGSQIDLLIVRRDQIINVCEMKYSEGEYVVDAKFDRNQKRKISDFIKKTETKYAIHSTLITTYGVSDSAYAGEIQSIITAEELFAK